MKVLQRFLIVFSVLLLGLVLEKAVPQVDYDALRKQYLLSDDDVAFSNGLESFLEKAKKENNQEKLAQGYGDAVNIVKERDQKIKFADQAIRSALLSNNRDTIGTAYLRKGIVYYFQFRQFKNALNQYLLAYKYLEQSENETLKHQNLYRIAEMKAYLGYHQEALGIFKKCFDFFDKEKEQKGLAQSEYCNSLHQMIVCLQKLDRYEEADQLLQKALTLNGNFTTPFQQSLFYKSKALSEMQKKHYKSAEQYFEKALPELIVKDDFITISMIHFYQGLIFEKQSKKNMALESFKKVDSIFKRHHFVLPEVRPAFEYLLRNNHNGNKVQNELYYTRQLLKVDENLSVNFQYLSGRIHKEFDRHILEAEQQLLKAQRLKMIYIIGLTIILLVAAIAFAVHKVRYARLSQREYNRLRLELRQAENDLELIRSTSTEMAEKSKLQIPADIQKQILQKLELFESELGFLEKGLTQQKLATKLHTNVNYLSQVINEYKGRNFNRYLGTLRIAYITAQLENNKTFQKYSVESLAHECGIASRQNFSDLFYDFNGMRPTEFLRQLKAY